MLSGAWPAWDIDPLRLALALARALWLAGLFSCAGSLAFRALEPRLADAADMRLRRLIRVSLAGACAAWLVWAALQALVLAGPAYARMLPVLWQTAFGRYALAQLALLLLARLTLGLPRPVPALLALGAAGLQVSHVHAFAMEDPPGLLTASVLLHLLAAALWLGSLLPLRLAVRHSGPAQAASVLRRYSARAGGLVMVLAATAFVQGRGLLGGLPGIAGTAYGWMAMAKLLLFAALLAFAGHHRWRLVPRLARPEPRPAQQALLRSLTLETGAGLAIVVAAALLSALPPGMHAQPVWPFALQPSLAAVQEDADFAREAVLAGAGVLAALLLGALAVAARVPRWPGLALAALLAWFAAPHLSLLLVPATATSFYKSPTGFTAAGIVEGATLYPQHCARCHGAEGRGDGPDAAALPLPPADLTAPHLWGHTDGELFGWLTAGMAAPDGSQAMPGFGGLLGEDERWQLIDFLRARNAGLARTAGAAPVPLQAPGFEAECAGGTSPALAELRGRPVRLVFSALSGAAPPALPGTPALTVFVPLPGAAEAAGGDCIASDPAVTAAYAIVTGLSPAQLAGASVLIDANGWLRGVVPGGAMGELAAALQSIAATPLTGAAGGMNHKL